MNTALAVENLFGEQTCRCLEAEEYDLDLYAVMLDAEIQVGQFWDQNHKSIKMVWRERPIGNGRTEKYYPWPSQEKFMSAFQWETWKDFNEPVCVRDAECRRVNPYVLDMLSQGRTRWQQLERQATRTADWKEAAARVRQLKRQNSPTALVGALNRKHHDVCNKCVKADSEDSAVFYWRA